MATYSLLFGHADWPESAERRVFEPPVADDHVPVEAVTIAVPAGLRRRLEATAELEGVAWETWAVRALARSIDPRLAIR